MAIFSKVDLTQYLAGAKAPVIETHHTESGRITYEPFDYFSLEIEEKELKFLALDWDDLQDVLDCLTYHQGIYLDQIKVFGHYK